MITLGCPTYRASAARLRFASVSLCRLCSSQIATTCLCSVDGDQDCDRGCVVLSVQETVGALDDWCTGLDL